MCNRKYWKGLRYTRCDGNLIEKKTRDMGLKNIAKDFTRIIYCQKCEAVIDLIPRWEEKGFDSYDEYIKIKEQKRKQ